MPFIYLFAVGATAVFLERLWFLRRKNIMPGDLTDRVSPLVEGEKWSELLEIFKPARTSLERVSGIIIENRLKPIDVLKEVVETAGKKEKDILRRGIGFISLTVSISPLLGLLGTVSGMIKVFSAISHQNIGNPEKLAAGISEALLTTFAGLTVAILALLMWSYLNSRVNRYLRELEEYSVELIQRIQE